MGKTNMMGLDLHAYQQHQQRMADYIVNLRINVAKECYVPLAQEKIRRTLAAVEEERKTNPEAGKEVNITFAPEMNLARIAADVFLDKMGLMPRQPKEDEQPAESQPEEKKSPILTA